MGRVLNEENIGNPTREPPRELIPITMRFARTMEKVVDRTEIQVLAVVKVAQNQPHQKRPTRERRTTNYSEH